MSKFDMEKVNLPAKTWREQLTVLLDLMGVAIFEKRQGGYTPINNFVEDILDQVASHLDSLPEEHRLPITNNATNILALALAGYVERSEAYRNWLLMEIEEEAEYAN